MRHRRDEGVVLAIAALSMVALLLIVAIVIDLGYTRGDRRGGQLAADNAATSAGLTLSESEDGEQACNAAFAYLAATLEVTFTGGDPCGNLEPCNESAATDVVVERFTDPYTVEIHHPVVDTSPLLGSTSTIGATGIAAGDDDGSPCTRIGIRITTTGDSLFGGIGGADGRSSTVHAVARADDKTTIQRPINLLVLDRTACQTFTANGGATVLVKSFFDVKDETWQPGVAGVDTDGSRCRSNEAAINVVGSTSKIEALGPCDGGNEDEDANDPCGTIESWASVAAGVCTPGNPGPDWPACDEGQGSISPNVTKSPARLTRAPIDHRYNCKASYGLPDDPWTVQQPIDACTDDDDTDDDFGPTLETDWVDELYDYVAEVIADPTTPDVAGDTWGVISGTACSPGADITYPPDPFDPTSTIQNWYVDCNDFRISGGANVAFRRGNVIFRDDVTVSSGSLTVNRCASTDGCASTTAWSEGDDFEEWRSSERGAWAYAGGEITNTSSITLRKTTLFLGPAGFIDQAGGSNLIWTAPNDTVMVDDDPVRTVGSAGPFEDLALWSEGTATHEFNGGGNTDFEGVFFAGRATIAFGGNSPMALTEAQFAANRLSFSGTTTFTMAPASDRSVRFDRPAGASLIR